MEKSKELFDYVSPKMESLEITLNNDVLTSSPGGTGGTIDPGEPIGD